MGLLVGTACRFTSFDKAPVGQVIPVKHTSQAYHRGEFLLPRSPGLIPRGFGLFLLDMEFVVESDLDFCRRRAVDFARQAVYSRDQKRRRALATMAQGWAELARAVRSVEPISAEFRLAAEIS
jgi:hypothetical protein